MANSTDIKKEKKMERPEVEKIYISIFDNNEDDFIYKLNTMNLIGYEMIPETFSKKYVGERFNYYCLMKKIKDEGKIRKRKITT